ncbi:MAG TPA: hypothetical protein VGM33_22855 [Baekduia sp.]|jgi:hypothetical protein
MSDQLDWTQTLGALLDFQGCSVIVQVGDRHDDGHHTPVLSAVGVLSGGASDTSGLGDVIALHLASQQGGNVGVVAMQRRDFEVAKRPSPERLLVHYAGLELRVIRECDPVEADPDAGAHADDAEDPAVS